MRSNALIIRCFVGIGILLCGVQSVRSDGQAPHVNSSDAATTRPAEAPISVVVENIDAPKQAKLGEGINITARFRALRNLENDQRIYVWLKQENVLWEVVDHEPKTPTSRWSSGTSVTETIPLPLPWKIPAGKYTLHVGVHNLRHERDATRPIQLSAPGGKVLLPLRRSLGYGVFIDEQKQPHRWYINRHNTLIWAGRPFIPVGGMIESYALTFGMNAENWAKDMKAIDLIRSKGVRDAYLHSPSGHIPTKPVAWTQPMLDTMQEKDFRFGLQLSSNEGDPECFLNAYIVRMHPEVGIWPLADGKHEGTRVGNFMIPEVRRSGWCSLPKPIVLPSAHTKIKSVNHVLYALFDKTERRMVRVGKAEFTYKDNKLNIRANVKLPNASHVYSVFFIPNITFRGPFVNLWRNYTMVEKEITGGLSKLRFGSGFRFFVDPMINEPGIYGDHAALQFHFVEFQAQFASWLKTKYGDIPKLNDAWAVGKDQPLPDFTTAGRLIALQAGSRGSEWEHRAYLFDPAAEKVYEVDYNRTLFWYDYLDFRHESFMEYRNRLCDAMKNVVDVPVVFKRAYVDNKYSANTRLVGGSDGIGAEVYGTGDRTTYLAMESFGKCRDSFRTMWCLSTETHYEGGMHFNYKGYRTADGMNDHFTKQLKAGSKGIFHFLLATCVGWNSHALVNDPQQLDWMKSYADLVQTRAEALANYSPAVYESWPAGGMCWIAPNDRTSFTRDDYYGGYSVETEQGVWFTPSFFPLRHKSRFILVNLENGPATRQYGPTFEELRADPGRAIVYVGFRRNLGSLSIDTYFTDTYKTLPDGSVIQVLKPTPTSKVLQKTKDGHVWVLQDGRLQIVSRSGGWVSLGGDPTIRYVNVPGKKLGEGFPLP